MARIVVFADVPRIYHVDDVRPYIGRNDVLIDPVYPPGIPPHLWVMKDGMIAIKEELPLIHEEVVKNEDIMPMKAKRKLPIKSLLAILAMAALALALRRLI